MQGVTVANIPAPQIRRLETPDAALYREIRLEALQRNPEAFGSTFERENAQPLSWFEAALGRAAIFGAFVDGTLAGVAGFAAQEDSKQARGRAEMVQLTVVSENEAARRLYRAMGFVEYGHEKRALKQDGRYYDEVLMVNFLDEGLS